MLPLSYTISSDLQELLSGIDILRKDILTTPLSPRDEQKLRWDATVIRIRGSLALDNIKLTKREVEKILAQGPSATPALVTGYQTALNTIQDYWSASAKTPTMTIVDTFKDTVCVGPFASYKRIFTQSTKEIRQLLTYLENQSEHPVIHAGVALGMLSGGILPAETPGLVPRLIALVFLAKYGYDLRGLSPVEHDLALEASSYHVALNSIRIGNMNHWLLFFAQAIQTNFAKVQRGFTSPIPTHASSKFWSLNERQRAILHMLDDPNNAITNKSIQKRFKISQITSSRDLAKLVSVGLLLSHGKGRSVSYTRI